MNKITPIRPIIDETSVEGVVSFGPDVAQEDIETFLALVRRLRPTFRGRFERAWDDLEATLRPGEFLRVGHLAIWDIEGKSPPKRSELIEARAITADASAYVQGVGPTVLDALADLRKNILRRRGD